MFDFVRMIWHAANPVTAGVGTTQTPPVQNASRPATDTKMHNTGSVPPPTALAKHKMSQSAPRDANKQDSPATSPSPPTNNGDPPRILTSPKRKRDYASEIVHEVSTASDPLPAGYIGTFRGTRFFAPGYHVTLGCANGLHHLSCGHWISNPLPCGVNCCSPSFDAVPFACPTCRDVVQDILSNKLAADETARLHILKERDAFLFVGCAVEFVTRQARSLKGNVTEAVLCALKPEYGRGCEVAAAPLPEPVPSIEQIVAEMQSAEEEKEKAYSNKQQKRGKSLGTFLVESVCGSKRKSTFGSPEAKKRRLS